MNREELRAWIQARRAAEARERREWTSVPDPSDAIRRSLGLIALGARLHGWPHPEDAVTRREDGIVYERWRRLRARMGP